MTEAMFPFNVYNRSANGGGVFAFRSLFIKGKPETYSVVEEYGTFRHERTERFTWYDFDVTIFSPTLVEFVCYDLDHIYGGRGKSFFTFAMECDASLTHDYIENRLYNRAVSLRQQELAEAEESIYLAYAAKEKKALGL